MVSTRSATRAKIESLADLSRQMNGLELEGNSKRKLEGGYEEETKTTKQPTYNGLIQITEKLNFFSSWDSFAQQKLDKYDIVLDKSFLDVLESLFGIKTANIMIEDKMGLSLRRMCTKKARTRSTEHGSSFITIEKTLSNIKM